MSRERPFQADSEIPLVEYLAQLLDIVEQGCDDPDSETLPENVAGPGVSRIERTADPNAPTFAELGSYFAAEIVSNPRQASHAAAHLGPKRVLALLA